MHGRDRARRGRLDRRTGASRRRCRAPARPSTDSAAIDAANYDELIDHPVEMGDFAHASFNAGGVAARDRDHRPPAARTSTGSARDLTRVCQWQVDLFGGAPVRPSTYLFQVTAVGDGYGGLEHRSSTSLLCRRDELPHAGMDAIERRLPQLPGPREPRVLPRVEREAHQAGRVHALRPRARELHAAAVGVRRHHVVLRRPGARALRPHRSASATSNCSRARSRRCCARRAATLQSVAESSFDAWIKYYRQDENTPNAVVSYYTKGALVALRARPHAAPRRAHVARPRDARAVGTPRRARHRRAGGRRSPRSRANSRAAISPISSRASSTAPRIRRCPRCSRSSASRSACAPAADARDRGGKPGTGDAAARARSACASAPT